MNREPNRETSSPSAEPRKSMVPADLLGVSSSPHIKHEDTTASIMADVLIALMPALIWGIFVFGWRVLTLTLVSVASCVFFEAMYEIIFKQSLTVRDLSAAVTGVLIAFNVPVTMPLWTMVLGGFFSMIVVKAVFGGIGKNIVNPALAARVFLTLSYPKAITFFIKGFERPSPFAMSVGVTDVISTATPLASLKTGQLPNIGFFDMLLGNYGGCIGEVSSLLLVAGGLYLLFRKVITWHIPAAYLGVVAVLTYLFPQSPAAYQFMIYELLSGGLVLGAVFMATDYTTSPVTPTGKLIFGAGCGLITVFIRYFGGYPEGVSFSILIMNLLVWYIDQFTKPVRFGGKSPKAPMSGGKDAK